LHRNNIYISTWGFDNFRLFGVRKLKKFLENLPVITKQGNTHWMESIVGAGLNISKSQIIDITRIIAVDQ